jgi:hypothetical protein
LRDDEYAMEKLPVSMRDILDQVIVFLQFILRRKKWPKHNCLKDQAHDSFQESKPELQLNSLNDDFWAKVRYCGYLRCQYQEFSQEIEQYFVNSTYASLVGLDQKEMMER